MLLRSVLVAFAAVVLQFAAPTAAHAQFPNKPLRFVVPWPPGGAADIMGRLIAEGLTRELGQAVVVDNRPGAAGMAATEQVTRMPADGYTLLLGSTGPNAIAASLYPDLRYNPVKDLTYVTQITELPLLLIVSKDLPVNSLKELIAYAKSHPGQLNFGSVGAGTAQHLAAEMFKRAAGIDIVHVPYKGSAPAFLDLAGGRIQLVFDNIPASQATLQGGKVKALAVTTAVRAASLPDVPTIAESGVPGFQVSAWQNIAMPPGSPPEAVTRLAQEIAKIMKGPEMTKKAADMGANVAVNSPAQEAERIRDETEKWKRAVTEAGVKLDK